MTTEKTFVMFRPHAVQRGIVGEIISRFEKAGLKIIGMKFIHIDGDFSKKHYESLLDKPFYDALEDMIVAGPVVAIVLEGAGSVSFVRKMVGDTEPSKSPPGTIRADFAHMSYERADSTNRAVMNVVHASDSKESAQREIALWFSQAELFDDYELAHSKFM